MDFQTYVDLPRPQVDWIVDDMIPRPGMIEIMGPPKSGKSYLALDLALRVSRGEPFLNLTTKAAKVLYCQLDTSERILKDRGAHLRTSGYNLASPNFGIVHPEDQLRPVNVMTQYGEKYFADAVRQFDPAMVVLDTLRECHQEDENDSTAMKTVMDRLEHLFLTRALVIIHHTSKLSPEINYPDPIQASRGSSYITGKVDAYWLLYKKNLHITRRWEEPKMFPLVQEPNGMWKRSSAPAAQSAAATPPARPGESR